MKFKNNKILLPLIVIVALTVGFAGSFAYASHKERNSVGYKLSHSSNSVRTEGPEFNITSDASIKDLKADKTIDLLSDKASPGEVTLPVGQVLQFNAKDGRTHRLALGEGGTEHEHTSQTDSGNFGADEAWRVRFDKPGTFYFHDHLSPKISVLVVVYQPSK